MYERREKARHDANMHERWAVNQSLFDIAKNLLKDGDSIEKIIRITGLTKEEVEAQLIQRGRYGFPNE
jgi:hypothetical protein